MFGLHTVVKSDYFSSEICNVATVLFIISHLRLNFNAVLEQIRLRLRYQPDVSAVCASPSLHSCDAEQD